MERLSLKVKKSRLSAIISLEGVTYLLERQTRQRSCMIG